eukprot:6225656-Amphidinium_carterae.1
MGHVLQARHYQAERSTRSCCSNANNFKGKCDDNKQQEQLTKTRTILLHLLLERCCLVLRMRKEISPNQAEKCWHKHADMQWCYSSEQASILPVGWCHEKKHISHVPNDSISARTSLSQSNVVGASYS